MTDIVEVEGTNSVRTAEFIKLTIETTATTDTYTFSSSYKRETIDGVEYTALGGLIAVGNQQRDLSATSYDTTIVLAGVDPANIATVLNSNIRGSEVVISRGFYNSGGTLTNVYPRFRGIVTGYSISETLEDTNNTFLVSINCSSYKTILENNVSGRRTNRDVWNQWYSGADTSMDNVEKLNGAYFDFGVPVK